jgi:hypothetical protein
MVRDEGVVCIRSRGPSTRVPSRASGSARVELSCGGLSCRYLVAASNSPSLTNLDVHPHATAALAQTHLQQIASLQ